MTATMHPGAANGAPAERTFHVVDVENLAGCGNPSVTHIRRVLTAYAAISGRRASDLVWIACSSPAMMMNIALATKHRGLACQSGPDGAERAIDDRLDWTWVAKRFSKVTIGSGDHFFAPRMAELASMGVHVTCVAIEGSLSAASRLASHQTLILPRRLLADPTTWASDTNGESDVVA